MDRKKASHLPGWYQGPNGTALRVYGPKEWFTPCAWDDWECMVRYWSVRCIFECFNAITIDLLVPAGLLGRMPDTACVVEEAVYFPGLAALLMHETVGCDTKMIRAPVIWFCA